MTQRSGWSPLPAADARAFDLVTVGECMVELWADTPLGEAAWLRRAYGGDTLNALVAAARLGARTAFVTRVGDDPFGSSMRRAWAAEGVDTCRAPLVDGHNGVYFISLSEDGEREFAYLRAGSAASRMVLEPADEACIADSRILLVSGITQAISPEGRAATLRAARAARTNRTWVAFDPNHRPALWQGFGGPGEGLAEARAAFTELLPAVDVLLPSFPADAALMELEHDDLGAVQRLRERFGIACVAIKTGAAGARLVTADGVETVRAGAVTAVVDTTGAGDAWNGAFLYALARGASPRDAAEGANRIAAAKLSHRGAIPPRDVVRESLSADGARHPSERSVAGGG